MLIISAYRENGSFAKSPHAMFTSCTRGSILCNENDIDITACHAILACHAGVYRGFQLFIKRTLVIEL